MDNRVDATLSAADQQDLLTAIKAVRDKLPFLIDLSPEERRDLPKTGDKSLAFVRKALQVATQNEGILPRAFDLAAYRRDVELFDAMQPILAALTQLVELAGDTTLEAGSEAYAASLLVYHYAQINGQGAALDELADGMAKRFARKAAPAPKTG